MHESASIMSPPPLFCLNSHSLRQIPAKAVLCASACGNLEPLFAAPQDLYWDCESFENNIFFLIVIIFNDKTNY